MRLTSAFSHGSWRRLRSIIEGYAVDAPDDVKNEAAIQLVGYLLDAPKARTPQNAFANSGAQLLLSRWHQRVSARVETV